MIWLAIKCIPYLILIAAALGLLGSLYANRNNSSAVGMMDSLKRFARGGIWVAFFATIAFFAVFCAVRFVYNKMFPQLYVSLNYDTASKGLNPGGTRYNSSEILSDEVLSEVIKEGAFNVSVDDLRDSLEIQTSFDDVKVSKILDSEDGTVDDLTIATDYRLVFKPTLKTAFIDAKTLLNLIGDVYYDQFVSEKTQNTSILSLDLAELEDTDYHSVGSYLGLKANNLKHFIDIYNASDSSYRDEKGDTFAALSAKLQSFIDVELERYNSYVVENGLSKKGADYSTNIDYQNTLLKLDYDKNMAAYNVRLEAIDMYDHQMARIVLVPTQDETLEYYMSRTKIGVDDYADEAQGYLADAKELKNTMDNNLYAQAAVNGGAATSAAYKKADEFQTSLVDELKALAEDCSTIVASYNADKNKAVIQTGLYKQSLTGMVGLKKGLLATAVFAVLFCGVLLCGTMYQRQRVKR